VARRTLTKIVVKAPDGPLDPAALATSMSDIGFARMVGVYGGARRLPGVVNSGFGQRASIPPADRVGIDYLIEHEITTREAAIAWLKSCLANTDRQPAAA